MRTLRSCGAALMLAVFVGATVEPTVVMAQDASASSTNARAIEQGKEAMTLYQQQKWADALDAFRVAEALFPSPVFALYSARCLEKLGRLRDAKTEYRRLIDREIEAAAPEQWADAKRAAQGELTALESQIPTVHVTLKNGSATTTATLDDAPIEGGGSIELDPGSHTLSAKDGVRQQTLDITLTRSEHKDIVIELPPPSTAPAARTPRAPKRRAPRLERRSSEKPSTPGLVITGIGGLTVIAGGVVGIVALHKASTTISDLPDSCVGRTCPESRRSEIESNQNQARSLATVSNGLFIGGAVVIAAGVITLLLDRPHAPLSASGAQLELNF